MKIGIFSETYLPVQDGVAYQIHHIRKELLLKGHEVNLFIPKADTNYEKSVHAFSSVSFPPYPNYRIALFPYAKCLKLAKDLDVLHIHTPFAMGMSGVIAKKLHKIPLVGTYHTNILDMRVNLHGIFANPTLLKYAWKFTVKIYGRCDIMTVPSQRIQKFLAESGLKPIVVNNGLDLNYISECGKGINAKEKFNRGNKFMVFFVGRASADKGLEYLIRACEGIDVQLVIAGIGPILENLKALSEKLNVNAVFTGFISDDEKYAIMKACDVFVLPSMAEVQPIVIIEAFTCGKTVIGTNRGGTPDMIENGTNGLLVEFGDVNALREAIIKLMKEKELKKTLSLNAKRSSEKYSIENVAKKYLEIYEELIKR